MTLEEFKNHPDMQQSIQLYRDALLEAGTDFETVRSGIDNILGNAAEKDFSTELAVENLMGDLHEMLNYHSPEVEDLQFEVHTSGTNAILTVEPARDYDIDPVEYHDGAIHDMHEQIEAIQEQEAEYEYDD